MKKLYLAVLVMAMFIFVPGAFAQETELIEVNKATGQVRISNTSWHLATELERQAYHNPGQAQIINSNRAKYHNDSFFWHKISKDYDSAVIFKDNKITTIGKTGTQLSQRQFSYHIVAILLAIIIMIFSQLLFKKDRVNDAKINSYFAGFVFICSVACVMTSVTNDETAFLGSLATFVVFFVTGCIASHYLRNAADHTLEIALGIYCTVATTLAGVIIAYFTADTIIAIFTGIVSIGAIGGGGNTIIVQEQKKLPLAIFYVSTVLAIVFIQMQ